MSRTSVHQFIQDINNRSNRIHEVQELLNLPFVNIGATCSEDELLEENNYNTIIKPLYNWILKQRALNKPITYKILICDNMDFNNICIIIYDISGYLAIPSTLRNIRIQIIFNKNNCGISLKSLDSIYKADTEYRNIVSCMKANKIETTIELCKALEKWYMSKLKEIMNIKEQDEYTTISAQKLLWNKIKICDLKFFLNCHNVLLGEPLRAELTVIFEYITNLDININNLIYIEPEKYKIVYKQIKQFIAQLNKIEPRG